jgi:hypothetical protein
MATSEARSGREASEPHAATEEADDLMAQNNTFPHVLHGAWGCRSLTKMITALVSSSLRRSLLMMMVCGWAA